MSRTLNLVLAWVIMLLGCNPLSATQLIYPPSATDATDVVIADALHRETFPGGYRVTIQIVEVLKSSGSEFPKTLILDCPIHANIMIGTSSEDLSPPFRQLWFLSARPGSAEPLLLGTPSISYAYDLPADFTSASLTAASTAADRIALTVAASVMFTSGKGEGVEESIRFFQASSSSVQEGIERDLAGSPEPCLQAVELALRISEDDPAALSAFASGSGPYGFCPASATIDLALSKYSSLDPLGINALGRLAVVTASDPRFRYASTIALERLHTPSSIRYLTEIASSADQNLRRHAAIGISDFAANRPPQLRHMTRTDILRRRSQHSRYGDDAEVAEGLAIPEDTPPYVAFWKGWVESHIALIQQDVERERQTKP